MRVIVLGSQADGAPLIRYCSGVKPTAKEFPGSGRLELPLYNFILSTLNSEETLLVVARTTFLVISSRSGKLIKK